MTKACGPIKDLTVESILFHVSYTKVVFNLVSEAITTLSFNRKHRFIEASKLAERSALHIEVITNQSTLIKTVSRISNLPFHITKNAKKHLHAHRKKASNHVSRKNAMAKSCFTKKYKYHSRFAKNTNTIIAKIFYLTLLKCTTVDIVAPGPLLVISDSVLVDV